MLIALLLAALPLLAQQIYLVPDSSGYVSYVHSLVWDGDFDFGNEYARLGMIDREGTIAFGQRTAVGRPGNPFGIGSALLWWPVVALAAVASRVAAATGATAAIDGFGTTTLTAVQLGTWTLGLGMLVLVAATLCRLFPATRPVDRRWALAGASLGTPFIYYILQMPTYSHVPSAFATALVLALAVRWRAAWTPRRALALGAAVGLAGAVRIQDGAALVLVPLLLAREDGGARPKLAARHLGLYAVGGAIAFAPQIVAWSSVYGSAVRIPQGAGFLGFHPIALAQVLVSSRHGWMAWSPVVILALWGWTALARDRSTRGLAMALGVFAFVEWVVNALPVDWWAGWSFGGRRFTSAVPVVAICLAGIAARSRAARVAIGVTTAMGLVQWLRVATRNLSGDADPGWGNLWGGGFLGFLPQAPAAFLRLVAAPWNHLQVLRHPGAPGPDLYRDPTGIGILLLAIWAACVLIAWGWVVRRTAKHSGT